MLDVLRGWRQTPIAYGQSQGEHAYLHAFKTYYHRLGYTFLDESHIQGTIGGSEAISMAMFATASPGDEILTFEPFYSNYNSFAAIHDVRLVPLPTNISDGFHLPTRGIIERAITRRTRAILICNPNNPTGTVYRREEIEMLVGIAKKHALFLLSDEAYREFVYDGRTHTSILSYMEDIPEKAILLDSVSKRYSLCGVRLGVLVTLHREIMDGVLRIAQGRLSAGYIDQAVAAILTDVPTEYMTKVRNEYELRRDELFEGLRGIPGVVLPKPEGAFYAIVGLPVADAEDFCRWLLTDFRDKNETVMLAPAAGFYATRDLGKNEVRIAYVLNRKSLRRSIDLLTRALQKYPREGRMF